MYVQNIASLERAKEIPGFYTKQDLKDRGWFCSTIDEVIPAFDQELPNPVMSILEPIYYYRADRVHTLEKTEWFINYQESVLQKAAQNLLQWGTSRLPFIDEIPKLFDLKPNCPSIEALNRDLKAHCQMRLPNMEPSKISQDIWANLAVQILMESFEPQLWPLEQYSSHPHYPVVVERAVHQLLKEIYIAYPPLLFGCQAFATRNYFVFEPTGQDLE